MKFPSAHTGFFFLFLFAQLTRMLLKTLLTENKIYIHVLLDESYVLMKEPLKRDQGTQPLNVSR